MAITPSRRPGPCPLFFPCAVRVDVLLVVINLQTVHSLIRYSTFNALLQRLPVPIYAGRCIRLE